MLSYLLKTFPSTIAPLLDLLDDTIAASDRIFPPDTTSAASTTPPRLSTIISSGPAPLLTATENAQPAILFTSLCFLAVLQQDFGLNLRTLASRRTSNGDSGLYILGHSLGEFSALVAAGIMTLPDAITLVRRRGITMTSCVPAPDRADVGMYALITPPEHLPSLIATITAFIASGALPSPTKTVAIANHNTSAQIVISGHITAITALLGHLRRFSGHDPRALRLNVSAPFHSPLMAPAVDVLRAELRGVTLDWAGRAGEVVGNVSARVYGSEKELRETLPRQAVERVRWAESVRYLEEERGVTRWLGFGPEVKVGRGLVRRDVRADAELVMVGEGMERKDWEGVVRMLEG